MIAPRDNAVGLTPTVAKVASGAAETVPYVQVTNLARTLDALKARGIWLVGLAGEAEPTPALTRDQVLAEVASGALAPREAAGLLAKLD